MGACRRCPCGGHYEARRVEVRFARGGEPRVVADVEQGACPKCGSRVYSVETLERLEALHRGARSDPLLNRLIAGPVNPVGPPP